jgi:hypothetical protein
MTMLELSSSVRIALTENSSFCTTHKSSDSIGFAEQTTVSVKSQILYDWRFTANQFVLATSPLRLTASNFILQLNTCCYRPYVTSSLTRGWVCRLQLVLGLASAVILRSESRGTDGHILLSQIRDFPNLEGHVPTFISSRNRVAQLYPQTPGSLLVSFNDSQGYGGGVRPRLHTGYAEQISSQSLSFVRVTVSSNKSAVASW